MTLDTSRFDALVIGAGVGGLCAAARLAVYGYRVVIVERLGRIGGRASTTDHEGFLVNTGATLVETGGVLQETFDAVGAPFEVRVPTPATLFRIDGQDVALAGHPVGAVVSDVIRTGVALLRSGDNHTMVADWVAQNTTDETARAIFRNLCAGIFALNADELPAAVFVTCFVQEGLWTMFGFAPTGTLGLLRGLADVVVECGGQVWLDTTIVGLEVRDGHVRSARTTTPEHDEREIQADVVISNIGPAATVTLAGREHFGDDYLQRMDRDLRPTADIAINISSSRPLTDAPGILTFSDTRRLCNMANLTATCPEMSPPGRHLAVAWAVPVPAVGDFDEDVEVQAAIEELRAQFPNFERDACILSTTVMRGEWPAQRSIAGLDLPPETTIANLWNVGDGVRRYATVGMPACAETARAVVEKITAHRDARPTRNSV